MTNTAKDELGDSIRNSIKAPLRSEISTADILVMGISSTKMSEIIYDIQALIEAECTKREEAMLDELIQLVLKSNSIDIYDNLKKYKADYLAKCQSLTQKGK